MFFLSNMTQFNDLTELWAFKVECPKRAKRQDHTLNNGLLDPWLISLMHSLRIPSLTSQFDTSIEF